MRGPYRAINRGNIKCFICDDIIDGKVCYDSDEYGTEAFCDECHNIGQEDKVTCAVCGKEVKDDGEHWTSGDCSIEWDTETRSDALLKSAREEIAAIGGTPASPVVFVGLASKSQCWKIITPETRWLKLF
jgi:hypothetical protein